MSSNNIERSSSRLRGVSTTFFIALLALGFTSFLLATPIQPAHAESLGAWTSTTSYPNSVFVQSCATSGGFIYCVGGSNNTASTDGVYFAPISSSGVGVWTRTTNYPPAIAGQSCVISGGYIYCVGGGYTSTVYYAPVSSSGVGAWTATTSYPTLIGVPQCATSASYIYCVGGIGDRRVGAPPVQNVYYAQVAPQGGGVGMWISTTDYPVDIWGQSCVVGAAPSIGSFYCIGGRYNTNGDVTAAVYYSPVSSQLAPTSQLAVNTLGEQGNAITGYYTLLYEQNGTLVSTGFSPATFTVNTGQAYTVAVDDYGSCQFIGWSTGNPEYGGTYGGSNSTTVSIAGDVSITATLIPTASTFNSTQPVPCGFTSSGVYIDSVDQTGQAISGYYTALSGSNGTVVGTGFTTTFFSTAVGQTYSVQADSYGSCTFSQWSDGVTSNPRPFVATNGDLFFTAVYDCATPAT